MRQKQEEASPRGQKQVERNWGGEKGWNQKRANEEWTGKARENDPRTVEEVWGKAREKGESRQ